MGNNIVAVIDPAAVGRRRGPWDDGEKTPTSPIRGQRWHRIWIESRYAKADELAGMRDLADRLEGHGLAGLVTTIWTDSKAC